jgi:hypothetical protein
MKNILQLVALVVLTVVVSFNAQAQNQRFQPEQQAYLKPSLKLTPAFGYRTFMAQYEHPINDHFSVSLLAGLKFSATADDNTLSPVGNDADKGGYLVDVIGRYYFKTAPSGFYLQGALGASNIIYRNGTVRPYSFTTGIKEAKLGTPTANTVPNPNAFRVAVGGGYQWTIIPRTLIADINLSVGSYSNTDGSALQLYFTPSVGYIF